MTCKHCGTGLEQHPATAGASKALAWHCNGCGCCFRDGEVRDGIEPCAAAAVPAPEPEPEPAPVIGRRRRSG